MGSIYRKSVTKALPAGAELFRRADQQFARWTDSKGKTRTAKTTTGRAGEVRIAVKAKTYTAKYRDGAGAVVEVATGCKDDDAAKSILGELVRRAELVKSGVISHTEDAIADQQCMLLELHFADYRLHLEAKEAGKVYCDNTLSYLKRLAETLKWTVLRDIERTAFDGWLAARTKEGMSARTRNAFRNAWVTFCNWATENRRLASNPLASTPRANEKADPKRQRRSLTEAELIRLLAVARRRPLEDARTVRAGRNRGKQVANLSPESIERLERLGRERAILYKVLVTTGLRKGELESLTVGQLFLEGDRPYAALDAADEKNRQGSTIPLRADVAIDLKAWIEEKRALANSVLRIGEDSAAGFSKTPLFDVPAGLVRILNRDLAMAKIPKRDDRDRTIDVHALRTTFGTLLSRGGVTPRVAQSAMRHSDIGLTMGVYTDPRLLDVHDALDALPALPLDAVDSPSQNTMRATGTFDIAPGQFAPEFAPRHADRCKLLPNAAEIDSAEATSFEGVDSEEHPQKAYEKRPLTVLASDLSKSERGDLNSRPLAPQASALRSQDVVPHHVASSSPTICTPVCTSALETDQQITNDPDLARLLAAWPSISVERRQAILELIE